MHQKKADKWNEAYMKEDMQMKNLARLEQMVNKSQFRIIVIGDDHRYTKAIRETCHKAGFRRVMILEKIEQALPILKDDYISLVFTSYEMRSPKYDCRDVQLYIRDHVNPKQQYLTFCTIYNNFTDRQKFNLLSDGGNVLPNVVGKNEEIGAFKEAVDTFLRAMYCLYLVDVVYGRKKVDYVLDSGKYDLNDLATLEDLTYLEQAASKYKYKILLVDDDPDMLQIMKAYVQAHGFMTITEAEGYSDTVSYLQSKKFDLILSDYRLQDRDANHIHDYITTEFKEKERPEMIIVTGFCHEEIFHLRKKGIRIIDKCADGREKSLRSEIEIIVKASYILHIRKLIAENYVL
jgi:CheY-like chemotaxis protein